MNTQSNTMGVWFVYDGECPICNIGAKAWRVKEELGEIHLLNAREKIDHKIIQEINARGYDLDEGMVIYDGYRFYHGEDALVFMTKIGKPKGWLNRINKCLFWSKPIANIIYPWMRGARNLTLKLKKIEPIDNLNLKSEPIFKKVFGQTWESLPPAIKKHYSARPYSEDKILVQGNLDIQCSGPIYALSSLYWLLGSIPPVNEKNVPVTVTFESDKNTQAFHFKRIFNLRERKPHHFKSRMVRTSGNELVEIMRFRLGWKMKYFWNGEKVLIEHVGYVLCLFGHFIPIPLTLIAGKGYAEEIPVDNNSFAMKVNIKHPLWGTIYEYQGNFKFVESENIL